MTSISSQIPIESLITDCLEFSQHRLVYRLVFISVCVNTKRVFNCISLNVNVSSQLIDVKYLIKSGEEHIEVDELFRKVMIVSFPLEVQFSVPWFCIRFGLVEKFDWYYSYFFLWYLIKIHGWRCNRANSSSSLLSCWTSANSAE